MEISFHNTWRRHFRCLHASVSPYGKHLTLKMSFSENRLKQHVASQCFAHLKEKLILKKVVSGVELGVLKCVLEFL